MALDRYQNFISIWYLENKLMDFDEILCMQYEIFPNFSIELWHLIDVKISIFLNIFKNSESILIKICLCIDIYDPWCD